MRAYLVVDGQLAALDVLQVGVDLAQLLLEPRQRHHLVLDLTWTSSSPTHSSSAPLLLPSLWPACCCCCGLGSTWLASVLTEGSLMSRSRCSTPTYNTDSKRH